jgi:hypothetical protein
VIAFVELAERFSVCLVFSFLTGQDLTWAVLWVERRLRKSPVLPNIGLVA